MNYTGVIIEESLENKNILKEVKISSTKIEKVTEEHKTPWIKQLFRGCNRERTYARSHFGHSDLQRIGYPMNVDEE